MQYVLLRLEHEQRQCLNVLGLFSVSKCITQCILEDMHIYHRIMISMELKPTFTECMLAGELSYVKPNHGSPCHPLLLLNPFLTPLAMLTCSVHHQVDVLIWRNKTGRIHTQVRFAQQGKQGKLHPEGRGVHLSSLVNTSLLVLAKALPGAILQTLQHSSLSASL